MYLSDFEFVFLVASPFLALFLGYGWGYLDGLEEHDYDD